MHAHACTHTHTQIADSMSGAFPAVAWCQIAVSTTMPGINCSGVFECVCWTAGLLHIFTSLDIPMAPTPTPTHTQTHGDLLVHRPPTYFHHVLSHTQTMRLGLCRHFFSYEGDNKPTATEGTGRLVVDAAVTCGSRHPVPLHVPEIT